jgi:hypothetical protein
MLIMRMIRICDYNFIIFQKKVLRQRAPRNLTTDGTPAKDEDYTSPIYLIDNH